MGVAEGPFLRRVGVTRVCGRARSRAWRAPARARAASHAAGGGRKGLPSDALIERVLGCPLGMGVASPVRASGRSQSGGPPAGVILELSCRRSI